MMSEILEIYCNMLIIGSLPLHMTCNHDISSNTPAGDRTTVKLLLEAVLTVPKGTTKNRQQHPENRIPRKLQASRGHPKVPQI